VTNTEWINRNLVKKYGIVGIKISMPLAQQYFLIITDAGIHCGKVVYQQVVGRPFYLSRVTRPEASMQVNLLGRRSTNPSTTNIELAKDLLRYCLSTKMEGIPLNKPENLNIVIYADASYGDPINNSGNSQSRTMITVESQLVNWWTRKQDVVSLSIMEAEYIAGCKGANDTAAMRQLTSEMKIDSNTPILMTCKIVYRMRRCIYYVSMVFSKDIFGAIYIEYIKGFVPIRYRGYCLCISPHLILIDLQARVFQHDGLRGCFKPIKNLEVSTTVETYRAQIPLPESGDQQGPLEHTTRPGEAEPSRCPHQDYTHDDHTKLEEKLEGWNEWEVQWNEWVNEEWMLE
jgi:hypothetical protein